MYNKIKIMMAATLLACVMTFSNKAYAGDDVFAKGTSFLQLGIGVGSPFYYSGSTASVPPIHASYEYGVSDKIGIGALVGYTSATWNPFGVLSAFSPYTYDWKFSYVIVGARGTYHFITGSKGDFYGGIMLGYNVASATFSTNDPSWNDPSNPFKATFATPAVGGLAIGGYIGGRYMFSDHIGIFGELGYNIAWVSVGLTAKF